MENEGHKVYGQNCFPLISLVPGIKFVPLRTNGGEVIPESGLFVRIKRVEDNEESGEAEEPPSGAADGVLDIILEDDVDESPHTCDRHLSEPTYPRRVSIPAQLRSTSEASLGMTKESVSPDLSLSSTSMKEYDNEVVLTIDIHPDDGAV